MSCCSVLHFLLFVAVATAVSSLKAPYVEGDPTLNLAHPSLLTPSCSDLLFIRDEKEHEIKEKRLWCCGVSFLW